MITLVIIGVVAALTIPNLLQKYQEQTTVKKLQKFYSNLSNAYNLAKRDNGMVNEWGLTGTDAESAEKTYEILFKPYFKISKDCGITNKGDCFANTTYKLLKNTNWGNPSVHTLSYKLSLSDGASVFISVQSNKHLIDVIYDVNGKNPPNQFGIDFFPFHVAPKLVFPAGLKVADYGGLFSNTCTNRTQHGGTGCTAWVIYKGNMDYLHCDGLTWTSRSCKDK